MKPLTMFSGALALAACFLAGCGQSSNSNDTSKTPAASPASAPAAPAVAASTPAAPPVVETQKIPATPPPVPDAAAASAQASAEPAAQFATAAAAQPDPVAASIGSDLTAKANALTQASQGNSEVKSQVSGALQSLSAGKDGSALTTLYQQAKQANLTPQQSQLVKDVGHLASAYVVQRNFSSVNGAQGDVATIVNSLRGGSITPALPALKSLASNASLTPQQKDLVGTLADQYAPGLKAATDSLKQGLQSIPGLK